MIHYKPITIVILLISISFLSRAGTGRIKKYVITDFGAVADGKTNNTKAIQMVIDKCATDGGGDVVVPKGTFITGAIFLKQGVNLRVEKEGMLKGTTKKEDYPLIATRWEGIECMWSSALINIENVNGVEISGEGTIDGSGTEWPKITRLTTMQLEQYPKAKQDSIIDAQRIRRPRLICFQNCKNVRIADLNLHNQAVWCLHILYCSEVKIENLNIRAAHTILSSDGIDLDSSNGVLVTGCSIDVNDDCISIKSGKDEEGLRINRPSENIIIEKTHFGYGHGGVAIGSETSGGIRKIEVRNCVADSGNWAPIRLKTQPSRGNVIEDITFRDMQLNNTKQAFEFNMEWRMVPPIAPPAEVLPVIKNIKIMNITGHVNTVGIMHGLKESPIENVQFVNCSISAQKGFVTEYVKNIDFTGLKLNVKEGDPMIQK